MPNQLAAVVSGLAPGTLCSIPSASHLGRRSGPRFRDTLLALAVGLAACMPPVDSGRSLLPAEGAEILWDEWGVPHLFAADDESLFFAYGWSQARSHGDLLLRLYGQARGRAAEYWGERFLDSDRWVWTMGIPQRAQEWYDEQEEPFRSHLDAFCAGINAYVREHGDAIADEVETVAPVDGRDVLAHLQRSIHFSFVTSPRQVAAARSSLEERGSNTWAVGPLRSSSGFAILVANPHLPWADLYTWHEAQLTSPDIDAYGAALVGAPFLGIAFNDHLGWSHTVNTHDGADLYELELEGDGYRYDGELRPFEVEEHALAVREENGTYRPEHLAVRRSVHGPVVAAEGRRALALRVVGLDAPHLLRQYWRMATATDRDEFEAALREMQMPMFTVMYADGDGHILHLFGGRTPVRSTGDWEFWSGVVPGDRSELVWTGVHPYEDLPRVSDPPTSWLQNANDPPWTTTFPQPLDPDAFPPYMAPRFMHLRAQRSVRMLAEDETLSFDEVVRYKLSTRMELADRILDDLDAAVRAGSGEVAKAANDVLQVWDRTSDATSRGAVLFTRFAERLLADGDGVFAEPWSEERPRATPDGFADPLVALEALETAAREIEAELGSLDVAWGAVHRLRREGRDLPANGGPGELGIFRVTAYERDADGLERAVGGDSYQAIIELSSPPRAVALLSYGNSSQPGSSHNGDQLELYSRQELRPVWRERAQIEAHLEEREVLTGLVGRPADS